MPFSIDVAARPSRLSLIQVKEVLHELRQFHDVNFIIHEISTIGDKDQKTSLRILEKTDFFTKEIDEYILQGKARIGIHSAKDLPDPLPKGLNLICMTKGLTSADSLVLRGQLFCGAKIATSSERREEMVKEILKDLIFCDIRGTIEQRLAKLESGEVDGVVVAEAALIRLGLTHLNRIQLPGPTVKGQGQLAVVARTDDFEMKILFQEINFGVRYGLK